MNTITTTLTTKAVFSEDGLDRYLLTKTWDEKRQRLAIIMMAPSQASGISLDTTTQLVLNNVDRLGYGSVSILNLFARVNDFALKQAEEEDPENLEIIVSTCQDAQAIIYAPGVGKATNKLFQERQKQVLEALRPMEARLHCLCDANGQSRLQHPLSPAVRTWHLSHLKVSELVEEPKPKEKEAKKPKNPKEEPAT